MEEEITVQVEEDPKKAERTLRPIMYVSWLLGVGIARPKKCPKAITIILRVIHFSFCTVIVAYSVMDFPNFRKAFSSKIFEIMYCMNNAVCYLSSYYYICHVIVHYEKWPELMKQIDALDRKIGKEIPINDRCVKIREIFAILTVCILGPIALIIHVLYYYFTNPSEIYASDLFLYYTIAQTLANSLMFDTIVYLICHRFRLINRLIEQLNDSVGTTWIALKIRKIRELHNDTCCLVATMNEIYGIDFLLCSSNSFIMVVAKLFRIYMSAAEHKNEFILLNNIIWMIYGCQFIVMCWVCTLTSREIRKIGILLYTFILNVKESTKFSKMNSFRSVRCRESGESEVDNPLNINYYGMENLLRRNIERDCVRNETNDFSSQLQQHHVVFSACDFFEVDNSLLTRFVSVITTYLIILVQFYRPQDLSI